MDGSVDAREVSLSIPPDASMLRVVRLTASSLAADLEFTVREIEDLVLAIDELTLALFEVADSEVSIRLRADDPGLTVRGEATTGGDMQLTELATTILARACDLYDVGQGVAGPSFTMVKVRESIA